MNVNGVDGNKSDIPTPVKAPANGTSWTIKAQTAPDLESERSAFKTSAGIGESLLSTNPKESECQAHQFSTNSLPIGKKVSRFVNENSTLSLPPNDDQLVNSESNEQSIVSQSLPTDDISTIPADGSSDDDEDLLGEMQNRDFTITDVLDENEQLEAIYFITEKANESVLEQTALVTEHIDLAHEQIAITNEQSNIAESNQHCRAIIEQFTRQAGLDQIPASKLVNFTTSINLNKSYTPKQIQSHSEQIFWEFYHHGLLTRNQIPLTKSQATALLNPFKELFQKYYDDTISPKLQKSNDTNVDKPRTEKGERPQEQGHVKPKKTQTFNAKYINTKDSEFNKSFLKMIAAFLEASQLKRSREKEAQDKEDEEFDSLMHRIITSMVIKTDRDNKNIRGDDLHLHALVSEIAHQTLKTSSK